MWIQNFRVAIFLHISWLGSRLAVINENSYLVTDTGCAINRVDCLSFIIICHVLKVLLMTQLYPVPFYSSLIKNNFLFFKIQTIPLIDVHLWGNTTSDEPTLDLILSKIVSKAWLKEKILCLDVLENLSLTWSQGNC